MSGFWSSTAFFSGGLINIDDINTAQFFPSSREAVGARLLVGKPAHANGDSPSDVFNRRPGCQPYELDRLTSRRNYSPAAIAPPILPRANLFQNEYTGITKAITFSPDPSGRLLDKEDVAKEFAHLVGNAMRFQASHRSRTKMPFLVRIGESRDA